MQKSVAARPSAQIFQKLRQHVQHREDVALGQGLCDHWIGVGGVEAAEDGILAGLPTLAAGTAELPHGRRREGGMRHEGRDALRSRRVEHAAALVERAAGSGEVIDHQHVVALGVALCDADDPAVAVSDLAAGDHREAGLQEWLAEALRGTVVREGDGCDGVRVRALLGPQRAEEERHCRLKRGDGIAVKVELVLQRVEVVDHDARGAAAGGQVRQQPGNGVGRGHLTLPLHALHCAVRVIREGEGEALDEGLAEGDQGMELRHHGIVAVEVCKEEHVPSLHEVHRAEATKLNLVCARVRELVPRGGEEAEASGGQGLQSPRHIYKVRGRNDVVAPAVHQAALGDR
mmetsp:Transcript_108197/g.316427  ORF Transcript_108197/g.316427 Transcript_108197/m.316427 type:complete len:346 (-) Transcript_108197:1323-2360(-)